MELELKSDEVFHVSGTTYIRIYFPHEETVQGSALDRSASGGQIDYASAHVVQ